MRNEWQEESRDARMQAWASAHHGIVTRRELLELGYSSAAISRRVQTGTLIKERPGVFRVAAARPSWVQRLYAVCRWFEPFVVASHRSAARLLELGDVRSSILEVTISCERRGASDVVLHSTDDMRSSDRRVKDQIPVTDPTRTVIDCCAVLPERSAEAVLDDACHQGLTTPERVLQRIDDLAARGRRGIALARALCERRIDRGESVESRLTRMLLRLIQQSHLPNPVTLFPVTLANGVTLHPDLSYPASLIAIEAEGYEHHGPRPGWQMDMHRFNPLQVLGWIVLRFSWEDVVRRPEYVIATIEDALRQRGAIL
jgi:hypothetical protein